MKAVKTRTDLRAAFEKFDEENPRIWELFVGLCERALRAGRRRAGARMIMEVIRWEIFVTTKSDDDFKINDHHTPYYARKYMGQHPELPEFFELRRLACERGRADFDEEGQGYLFDV